MPERDDLDHLIDSALTSYAEPRPGLEQRTLARISAEAPGSSRRRWIFAAIAAPAVAALIFLIYLLPKTPHSQPGQMAHTPATPSVAPVVATPALRITGKAETKHRIRQREQITDRAVNSADSRPKLDVFPTPQPLSAGEQSLIRFGAQAREADRKALVEAQQRLDEPLKISAIRIPPLQSPEENH